MGSLFVNSLIDHWVEIASTLTAGAAVIIAVREARQAREHNRLSVRPFLNLALIRGLWADRIGIQIGNLGLGPAVIRRWDIRWRNKRVDLGHDWEEALREYEIPASGIKWDAMGPSGVIQVRETLWIVSVPAQPDDIEIRGKFDRLCKDVSLTIECESLYGERLPALTGPFKPTVA